MLHRRKIFIKKSTVKSPLILIALAVGILILFTSGCRVGSHGGARFHKTMKNRMIGQIHRQMDDLADELDLTDEQKEAYERIKQDMFDDRKEMENSRKEFLKKVSIELEKETPDPDYLAGVLKIRISGFINEGLDNVLALYHILDEDQKTVVNEKLRENLDKFRKFDSDNL